MANITKVEITNENWNTVETGLLVVGVYKDKSLSWKLDSCNATN